MDNRSVWPFNRKTNKLLTTAVLLSKYVKEMWREKLYTVAILLVKHKADFEMLKTNISKFQFDLESVPS